MKRITIIGYMDTIDFLHELDSVPSGTRIYPTIQDLKKNHECWKSCGIVKVKVILDKMMVMGKNELVKPRRK